MCCRKSLLYCYWDQWIQRDTRWRKTPQISWGSHDIISSDWWDSCNRGDKNQGTPLSSVDQQNSTWFWHLFCLVLKILSFTGIVVFEGESHWSSDTWRLHLQIWHFPPGRENLRFSRRHEGAPWRHGQECCGLWTCWYGYLFCLTIIDWLFWVGRWNTPHNYCVMFAPICSLEKLRLATERYSQSADCGQSRDDRCLRKSCNEWNCAQIQIYFVSDHPVIIYKVCDV